MLNVNASEILAKYAELKAAYTKSAAFLEDDENLADATDEMLDQHAALFAEVVALEETMMAAGIAH